MQTRSKRSDTINFRQFPQAIEAEQSILSASMLGAAGEVLSMLKPDDFYRTSHQQIMQAVVDLHNGVFEVNLVTVTDHLRTTGNLEKAGGASYVSALVDNVPAAGSVEWAAGRIREAAARRRMIQAANDLARAAYDEPDLESLSQQFSSISKNLDRSTVAGSTFTSYRDLAESEPEKWEKIGQGITGIPTGFSKIDGITGGFQPSDLIVLAARPGMGKTAIIVCMAENIARQGFPVAIFSLEMNKSQLYARQTARVARIDSQRFRVGGIQPDEWKRVAEAQAELHGLQIYIDDTPRLHIQEIVRRARYAVDKLEVKLIAIDYLQLIRGDNRQARKDLEIGDITGQLKGLAKEFNVPVILLSQLNRGVENRDNKRPRLSDLRESGAIEQDADIVAFLYRDEYYNSNTKRPGIAELNFAKHRNGPTGNVFLTWIDWRQSFENLQGQ